MANKEDTIDQKLIDLVVENKDKKDDDILGLMIQSGLVSFAKARKVLAIILVKQGLRMTKEQRDEKAEELMSGFEINGETTPDEVAEQIELIMSELDCTKGIARNYVKASFLDSDVDMPKATSGGGIRSPRPPGFGGDVKLAADWLIGNPSGARESFNAHMEEKGAAKTTTGKDKTARWFSVAMDLKQFAADWKEAGNCA